MALVFCRLMSKLQKRLREAALSADEDSDDGMADEGGAAPSAGADSDDGMEDQVCALIVACDAWILTGVKSAGTASIVDDTETREMQAHLQLKLEEEEERLQSHSEIATVDSTAGAQLAPAYRFPRDVHFAWKDRVEASDGAGGSLLSA